MFITAFGQDALDLEAWDEIYPVDEEHIFAKR